MIVRFLALKSLRNRKLISSLCVLSIALSLSLFFVIEKIRVGVEEGFTNSISNADLIVGSRSGPLQLLLYSVFHMGSPTNNISYETYEKIKNNPAVSWTIPISLGDSYKGHRVVATNDMFFKHYQFHGNKNLEMAQGNWIQGIFDVVLGHKVAKNLNHKLGDSLILSHGISSDSILNHDNTPFKVKGILKPTGTPIDKSVYITLFGMEALHIGWENGVPSFDDKIDQNQLSEENLQTEQITSFILRTKNRIALLGLQRFIGTYESEALSAIIPALTLAELWGLLDQLKNAFLGVGFFVIIIGFLSIFIALYMSLNERQREMAILRSIGVSPSQITLLLFYEATLLSVLGAIMGFILQYLLLAMINPILEAQYSVVVPMILPTIKEAYVAFGFIVLGSCFGIIPAIKAYRTSLHNGLTINK